MTVHFRQREQAASTVSWNARRITSTPKSASRWDIRSTSEIPCRQTGVTLCEPSALSRTLRMAHRSLLTIRTSGCVSRSVTAATSEVASSDRLTSSSLIRPMIPNRSGGTTTSSTSSATTTKRRGGGFTLAGLRTARGRVRKPVSTTTRGLTAANSVSSCLSLI